jgi:hypothetical protein
MTGSKTALSVQNRDVKKDAPKVSRVKPTPVSEETRRAIQNDGRRFRETRTAHSPTLRSAPINAGRSKPLVMSRIAPNGRPHRLRGSDVRKAN